MKILTLLLLSQLQWQTFFSPKGGIREAIIRSIDSAQVQVLVQAYSFTSKEIMDALLKKKCRSPNVEIVLLIDRKEAKSKKFKRRKLREGGITVRTDIVPGKAHDKVIIIDSMRVITGSYNYTSNAEENNAENVIIIDNSLIATQYLNNWAKLFPEKKKK